MGGAPESGSQLDAETYKDITKLRLRAKKAQEKAAKLRHKATGFETRAHRCLEKATRLRQKAGDLRDKATATATEIKEWEAKLPEAPEKKQPRYQSKILSLKKHREKLAAKAASLETDAADLNHRAAQHQEKRTLILNEANTSQEEGDNLAKRADNIEMMPGSE